MSEQRHVEMEGCRNNVRTPCGHAHCTGRTVVLHRGKKKLHHILIITLKTSQASAERPLKPRVPELINLPSLPVTVVPFISWTCFADYDLEAEDHIGVRSVLLSSCGFLIDAHWMSLFIVQSRGFMSIISPAIMILYFLLPIFVVNRWDTSSDPSELFPFAFLLLGSQSGEKWGFMPKSIFLDVWFSQCVSEPPGYSACQYFPDRGAQRLAAH